MGQSKSRTAALIDLQIGLRLRRLRQERGLTLKALAEVMGHSSGQAVSKYEQGSALPAALMLRAAESLGVPVTVFFQDTVSINNDCTAQIASLAYTELSDNTEIRKIVEILRRMPRARHAIALRVVRALADGDALQSTEVDPITTSPRSGHGDVNHS